VASNVYFLNTRNCDLVSCRSAVTIGSILNTLSQSIFQGVAWSCIAVVVKTELLGLAIGIAYSCVHVGNKAANVIYPQAL